MYTIRAYVCIREKLIFPDLPVITVHLRTEHDMLIFLSATRRAFEHFQPLVKFWAGAHGSAFVFAPGVSTI